MDQLTKLLAIDAPTGTRLQSAELHFRGLIPWWAGLVLLVVLSALVIYLYMTERARLNVFVRVLMALVRTAIFALLLFLLCRPVLLAEFAGQRPRDVVVVVDNSQSISQHDRRLTSTDLARVSLALGTVPPNTPLDKIQIGDQPKDPSRRELIEGVLKNPELKLLPNLAKVGPVRTYLFGAGLKGLQEDGKDKEDPAARLLANLNTQDAKTALADSLLGIFHRKDGELPAAVVVITDGRDNASKYTLSEAGLEAGQLKVPLHIYGVGSADAGSLQLREVVTPNTMFAKDKISIPMHWRTQGLKKGKLELQVKLGDKVVETKEIDIQPGDDLREILSFEVPEGKTKDSEEIVKLTTSIRLKGSEQFKDSITRDVRMVDRKIKVLVIEHAPRFEYKFLQGALMRDRRIEPTFLLVNADPKVAKSGPPYLDEFPKQRDKFFDAKYNVIVLGDVAADYLNKEQWEWIREFVANRGGLIAISGRQHMPAEYGKTPLAEVLPVETQAVKPRPPDEDRTQEYPPTLTDLGLRLDMLSLGDTAEENQKIWKELPGFYGFSPITKLRPGAQVLIANPRAKLDDKPMPVFVTQYYGKGQVLLAGTDETWRWRANAEDKHFRRFWGQILYHLGLPSLLGTSSSRVQMALDRSEAVIGRPGSIYVRLLDKDFNPRKDQNVEATIEYLDAKPGQERVRKLPLQLIAGRDGDYQGFLTHEHPGRYEVKVGNPEPATFSFRVELPSRHELEESGLAVTDLTDLAKLSGGRFYREEDLSTLVSNVAPQLAPFTMRQEILLWTPLLFLVFLALITIEWVARKFANLI